MRFSVGQKIKYYDEDEVMTITEIYDDESYRIEYFDGDWDWIAEVDELRFAYEPNMPVFVDALMAV